MELPLELSSGTRGGVWLSSYVTPGVVDLKCRPCPFSLGPAWLERSVAFSLDPDMPAAPRYPIVPEASSMAAIIGVDPHKHVLSAIAPC